MKSISIIIPTYNSEQFLHQTLDAVALFVKECSYKVEVILVDDASTDNTFNTIITYPKLKNLSIKAVQLFVNRGQFHAIMAGFTLVEGDYIVTLDDDLEYQPREITKLIHAMEKAQGAVDVVIGRPIQRKRHPLREVGSWLTNKANAIFFKKPKDVRSGSFRVLARKYVDKISEYRTANPILGPLIFRSTNRIINVEVEHSPQIRRSNYQFSNLLDTFVRNFQSYSELPLRYIAVFGLGIAALAFFVALFVVFQYFTEIPYPIRAPGWTSLIVSIWFLSGIVIAAIGLIGQYIYRIIEEVSHAPNFQIRQIYRNKE